MRTALSIAGSDSSGGAGVQADLKTMTMNGVFAMSAITALTAQNTTGVTGILEADPEFLKKQIDAVFEDIRPDAVKIGMVSSSGLIKTIAERLQHYKAENIVVDPVMVATSGSRLLEEDAVDTLKKELLPIATVITPNIPEAEILCGMEIHTEEDMVAAAKAIYEDLGCAVLLKGGHNINDANDLLYTKEEVSWFKGKRINNPNTHGTGCTLSSAIASNLAKGRNLDEAVEKAKAYIMSGDVYVDGQKEDKAGTMFKETVKIEVRGNTLPYVSRGGLKLEKAIKNFDVNVEGKVCTDVGSSTGGFTDCMLQNGAVKVFAIDVGRGQLDWKLRQDPRVVCMEKTNIRYVTPEDIGEPVQFSSIDVSFISLTKVLLPIRNYLTDEGQIVALIKPQFEAGREKVGKKGVVREKSTHIEVIHKVIDYAMSIGFEVLNLEFSPIKGPEGNIEYLVHLQKCEATDRISPKIDVEKTVDLSFATLAKG